MKRTFKQTIGNIVLLVLENFEGATILITDDFVPSVM